MKKIAALVLMICFLCAGTIAYATTDDNTDTDTRRLLQQQREELKQKIQAAKSMRAELQPLLDQVRENRIEILRLKADYLQARNSAAQHIRELRGKDNLTEEQITQLKNALQELKESRQVFADTRGDIHSEVLVLRDARRDQDIDKAKSSLQEIISVQTTRINLLKSSIQNIKRILEI